MAQGSRKSGGIGVTKGDTLRRAARQTIFSIWKNGGIGRPKGLKSFGLISVRVQASSFPPNFDAVAKRKGKRLQPVDRKFKSFLRLHKMTLLKGGNSCPNV